MSALFGRPKRCLQRIFIILVCYQLLLAYLSLRVTCPYVIPDLNELPLAEGSNLVGLGGPTNYPSSFEERPLVVEPALFGFVTGKHAIHSGTEEDQASSVRTSKGGHKALRGNERLTGAEPAEAELREVSRPRTTEAGAPQALPSKKMPIVFLDTKATKVWQQRMDQGRSRCKIPDLALMSCGIKYYSAFRKRHVVKPTGKKFERRKTLDLASELMGDDELRRLGLMEDKHTLIEDLSKEWFGDEPKEGWAGRERGVLSAVDLILKATVYYIRLLHDLHQPSLLQTEKQLSQAQRSSFKSLSALLKRLDPKVVNKSKDPAMSLIVGRKIETRMAKALGKVKCINRGQRVALAWLATEYCIEKNIRSLDKMLIRARDSLHRNYKYAVGDKTIASASQLPNTPIEEKYRVQIEKPFFVPSRPKNQ